MSKERKRQDAKTAEKAARGAKEAEGAEEAGADAEQERLETGGLGTKEGLEQQRLEKEELEKEHVVLAAKPNVDKAAAPYSIPLQLIPAPRIPPHLVVLSSSLYFTCEHTTMSAFLINYLCVVVLMFKANAPVINHRN